MFFPVDEHFLYYIIFYVCVYIYIYISFCILFIFFFHPFVSLSSNGITLFTLKSVVDAFGAAAFSDLNDNDANISGLQPINGFVTPAIPNRTTLLRYSSKIEAR